MKMHKAIPTAALTAVLAITLMGATKCSPANTVKTQGGSVVTAGGMLVSTSYNPPLSTPNGVWVRAADGRWIFSRLLVAAAAAAAGGYMAGHILSAAGDGNGRVFSGRVADNPCHGKRNGYRLAEWQNRLGKRVYLNCFTYRKIIKNGARTHLSNFYKCVTRVLIRGVSTDGAVWRLALPSGGNAAVYTVEQADGSFKVTSASPPDGNWASCANGI